MTKKEDYINEFIALFDPSEDLEKLPYCETGEVESPLPNLKIKLRGLTYTQERIKLNEYWMPGHKRKITIPSTSFSGSDSRGDAHGSGGFPEAEIIFKDSLVAGDLVACLQSKDKQTLYVLYRIASI